MVIGVPTWEDRVSPVLDTAERVVVVDTDGGPASTRVVALGGLSPRQRVVAMREAGIDVLICGGITRRLLEALTVGGMTVVPWVSGPVEEVIDAFGRGRLEDGRFWMPGCGRRRRRGRGGRGRGGKGGMQGRRRNG